MNHYGAPANDRVYGVKADGISMWTRIHEWKIQRKSVDGMGEEMS